jgi:WD40 repeat protein
MKISGRSRRHLTLAAASCLLAACLFGFDGGAEGTEGVCPAITLEKTFRTEGSPGALAWSNDGRLVATADDLQRRVTVWDFLTQTKRHTVVKAFPGTGALTFGADGKTLLTSIADPTPSKNVSSFSIIDVGSGKLIRDVAGPFDPPRHAMANVARKIAVSPKTGFAAVITDDGPSHYVNFYKMEDWSLVGTHRLTKADSQSFLVADIAFNPASGELAILGISGGLQIWNPPEKQPAKRLWVFSSRSYTLAYSPNGDFLTTGIGTGLSVDIQDPDPLRLWNAKTWVLVSSAKSNSPGDVHSRSLSFSSAYPYLASLNLDGKVRLWDSKTLSVICQVEDGGKGGVAVAFSPDGQRLAILRDHEARIVRIEPGR